MAFSFSFTVSSHQPTRFGINTAKKCSNHQTQIGCRLSPSRTSSFMASSCTCSSFPLTRTFSGAASAGTSVLAYLALRSALAPRSVLLLSLDYACSFSTNGIGGSSLCKLWRHSGSPSMATDFARDRHTADLAGPSGSSPRRPLKSQSLLPTIWEMRPPRLLDTYQGAREIIFRHHDRTLPTN
jgi:hypothetical protein